MRMPICILAPLVCLYSVGAFADDTPDQQTPAPAAPVQGAAPTDAKPADATPPAPPPKYDGWAFSALADAYVNYNSTSPSMDFNQLQNFNLHTGAPRLTLAKFTVDKSDKVFGIHLDVGVGETMRLIHAADPAAVDHKGLRYVEQAYLIFKPNKTHGTEIDFGQFVTSAGAEVIESSSNWNYTRSLLFSWAIPYYHFGFKTTTPITKELTLGFQLVNGWNSVWGNNDFQNGAVTLALTKTKYTWSGNYYVGKSDLVKTAGVRNLLDSTVLFTPNAKLNLYVNGDFGRDNVGTGAYAQWYGLAGAARYQLTKLFAIAGRAEVFNDAKGFSTGTAQLLKEATGTVEYKMNDHLVTRFEARHDSSDHPFFDQGNGKPLAKGDTTVTFGVVALLGPLK